MKCYACSKHPKGPHRKAEVVVWDYYPYMGNIGLLSCMVCLAQAARMRPIPAENIRYLWRKHGRVRVGTTPTPSTKR